MVKVFEMPNIPFTIQAPKEILEFDAEDVPGIDHKDNLARPLKVSDLVLMLKNEVEKNHRQIKVIGELSSFKQWRSGHCYFDIKDELAVLPGVMFKPHVARLPFEPKDGQEILFCGRVSIYPANSKLQMIVESMEPLGQGALALAFEQLKHKLAEEGLFEAYHKKPIKRFNTCVGLITSSHGAVLRDMVRILKSRMPQINILFSPVRVQGAGAAAEIKQAIELLDSTEACDVIIVGRGGGSLEDLWPFNEEIVARAIFAAQTPIISAVGHETDFSISDFVADIRAATPTHAATLAVPDLKDILQELEQTMHHLNLRHKARIHEALRSIAQEKKRLHDPRIILFKHWQEVDEHAKRLHDLYNSLLKQQRKRLTEYIMRLGQNAPWRLVRMKKEALFLARASLERMSPKHKFGLLAQVLQTTQKSLTSLIEQSIKLKRSELASCVTKLDALSPLKVLIRGYSVVKAEDGSVLSKKSDFYIGQSIEIRVSDGSAKAKIL